VILENSCLSRDLESVDFVPIPEISPEFTLALRHVLRREHTPNDCSFDQKRIPILYQHYQLENAIEYMDEQKKRRRVSDGLGEDSNAEEIGDPRAKKLKREID